MSNHNKCDDETDKITEHKNPATIPMSTTTAISNIMNENNEQPMAMSQEGNDDDDNDSNDGEKSNENNLRRSSLSVIIGCGSFEEMVDWRNPDDVPHPEVLTGIRADEVQDTNMGSGDRKDQIKWDDPKNGVPRPEILPPMMPRANAANGHNNSPEECFLDDVITKKSATSSTLVSNADHRDVDKDNISSRDETGTDHSPTTLPRPGATWVGSNDTDSTSQRTIESEPNESNLLPLGAIVVDDEIQNLTNERENERRRANDLAEELARYNQIPVIEGQASQNGVKYLSKRFFISIFLCLAVVISVIVGVTIAFKPTPINYPTISNNPSISSNPSTSRTPSSRPTLSLLPSQTPTTIPTFVNTNVIAQDYIQTFKGSSNGNKLKELDDNQREYYQNYALVSYTKQFAGKDYKYVTSKYLINRQMVSDDWLRIYFSVNYTSIHINVTNYPEDFKSYMNSVGGKNRTRTNLQSVEVAVDVDTGVGVFYEEDLVTFSPSMTPTSMVSPSPIVHYPTNPPNTSPTLTPTPEPSPPTTLYPTIQPTLVDIKIISQDFTHVFEGVGLEELDTNQIDYLQRMYSSYTKIFALPNNDHQFIETVCLWKNQTYTSLSQQQRHLSLLQSNKVSRFHTLLSNNLISSFSSLSSQRRENKELPSTLLEVKFKMTYYSSKVDVVENNYPSQFTNYVNSYDGKTRTLLNLQSIGMSVERIHDLSSP